jgi:hypothetical protein
MQDDGSSSFDVTLRELMASLAEAVELLREHGEQHWSGWLERCLVGLERYDSNALDQLLNAYGGMGSFNDLALVSGKGPEVSPADVEAANHRLDALRTRCYSLAEELRRQLRRP